MAACEHCVQRCELPCHEGSPIRPRIQTREDWCQQHGAILPAPREAPTAPSSFPLFRRALYVRRQARSYGFRGGYRRSSYAGRRSYSGGYRRRF